MKKNTNTSRAVVPNISLRARFVAAPASPGPASPGSSRFPMKAWILAAAFILAPVLGIASVSLQDQFLRSSQASGGKNLSTVEFQNVLEKCAHSSVVAAIEDSK